MKRQPWECCNSSEVELAEWDSTPFRRLNLSLLKFLLLLCTLTKLFILTEPILLSMWIHIEQHKWNQLHKVLLTRELFWRTVGRLLSIVRVSWFESGMRYSPVVVEPLWYVLCNYRNENLIALQSFKLSSLCLCAIIIRIVSFKKIVEGREGEKGGQVTHTHILHIMRITSPHTPII